MKAIEWIWGMLLQFLIVLFKGDWLASGLYNLAKLFEFSKFITYSIGIVILVGLGVLSVGTFIYLVLGAFNYPTQSFQWIYEVTYKMAKDEAAWGAFVILAALITFIHREQANAIQQANLRLQKKKWQYEKDREDKTN